MADRTARRQALDDLLVQRSTEGLGPEDEVELGKLLGEFPETGIDAYERAAALVWLAASHIAEMPVDVAGRVLARARHAEVRN